jgi:hypothetical protein
MASHRGGPGSSPGLDMWDLWWTKWRWGRLFPSTSVSLVNIHSTNSSTITIIYHLGLVQYASTGRRVKWTQSHLTKKNNIPAPNKLNFTFLLIKAESNLWFI